jgi:hypothetical protein
VTTKVPTANKGAMIHLCLRNDFAGITSLMDHEKYDLSIKSQSSDIIVRFSHKDL